MNNKPIFKIIDKERFIIDLIYKSKRNYFYKDMYSEFNINKCYVHVELYNKLINLVPILQEKKLKLVIFDTLRPWAVQKFMYESAPDYLKPFIAPPPEPNSTKGFHPRGTAIDCYLANEDGTPLSFPTTPDAFYEGYEKDPNYIDYLKRIDRQYFGKEITKEQIRNRELLEKMMTNIGLEPLPTEWWHFNLPGFTNYPIVYSLNDIKIK